MKYIKDVCVFIIFVMVRVRHRLDEALAYSKRHSKLDEALAFSSFVSMNPELYPVEQENDLSKHNVPLEAAIPKKVLGPIAKRSQWR